MSGYFSSCSVALETDWGYNASGPTEDSKINRFFMWHVISFDGSNCKDLLWLTRCLN